jgi:hypothetical protein
MTSPALRQFCNSTQYRDLRISSSLRQERNINNPSTCLHMTGAKTMKTFYIRLIKELLKRHYERKEILIVCRDIKPFFDYLRNDPCVKSIRGILPHHVRDYADRLKRSCTATTPFMTVLETNDKLCALKMFCLQIFIAGLHPRDYSADIGFIDLPARKNNSYQQFRSKETGWKR